MTDKKTIKKELINARLLKNSGSWIYCNSCGSTLGYLCYSTYDYFNMEFVCNCGEHGSVEIGERNSMNGVDNPTELIVKKGRLCCPNDQSPLFSIVEKNLKNCNYEVICKECAGRFLGSK